jgi:hypothetical protein
VHPPDSESRRLLSLPPIKRPLINSEFA